MSDCDRSCRYIEPRLALPIAPKTGLLLRLRLVAVKKPAEAAAAAAAREKAKREAQRGGHNLAPWTLVAAEWVILATSLAADAVSADDILALYRLRWRIELRPGAWRLLVSGVRPVT